MNEYRFVWKGKDPTGKRRAESVVASDAQEAGRQLTAAGWTELELLKDEIGAMITESFESQAEDQKLYEDADTEAGYFEGKRPSFVSQWLKGLWEAKGSLLVGMALLAWGIYSHRIWPILIGGVVVAILVLLHPVIHLALSGGSRGYDQLNHAKVWARHDEVLECVEKLRQKKGFFGTPVGEVELAKCRSQALAAQGKLDVALAGFKPFEDNPKLERWLYLSQLATIYDAAKAYDLALPLRQQAVEAKPESSATWIDLAYGNVRGLNQPKAAREALAEAERREITGLGKAYLPFLRGIICWREQNFEQAIKELDAALVSLRPFAHNALVEGLFLLAKSHLCAAHRALGHSAPANQLLRQVEKYLTAHKETELLAACRGAS